MLLEYKILVFFKILVIAGILISPAYAAVIHIPDGQGTIQSGIDAAANNDTVLVAPGKYFEHVELKGKGLTLASWYLTTGDTSYIRQTVIDGNDSGQVIYIDKDVGPLTLITGLTIQNTDDGIACKASVNIQHNLFQRCKDAIDYEGNSGGVCSFNVFERNKDDAIDLDDNVDIVIEGNVIRNNNDDGIEIRLYDYTGPLLTCIIRDNIISGNGEDGIQIIDYKELSDRVFYIEHNLICNNEMVGLGCMGNQNTTENYEGAGIAEPIYVFNNTFVNNNYGITGGTNLVALNNILLNHPGTAMKNVKGNSIVSYGAFWGNGADMDSCNVPPVIVNENPLLDKDYKLMLGSPCIDRGTAFFVWQGDTVLNLSSEDYLGTAPDIGAFEFDESQTGFKDHLKRPVNPELFQNYPNPFNPVTNIRYIVYAAGFVKMDIYDITGRRVSTLVNGFKSPGKYTVTWAAKDGLERFLPSGLYFCRLRAGPEWKTIKLILME